MLIIYMFEWWYVRGWRIYLQRFVDQLKNAADFFSMRLLVRHMFAPFRQIGVGETAATDLGMKFSALLDRLFSRVIGTIVRLFLLIIGTVVIILQTVLGIIVALLWPLAPVLIIVCLILAIMQVRF